MNLCGVGILHAIMLIKYSIWTCSRMLFYRIQFVWSRWACMNLFLSF